MLSLFCSFEKFNHKRNTYKLIKKLKYFHVWHTIFAMSDKRKYIKSELGKIISYVKVHTSCFHNENHKLNKTYPNSFMAAPNFLEHFYSCLSLFFNKLYSSSRELLLQIYLNLFFTILHEILYT